MKIYIYLNLIISFIISDLYSFERLSSVKQYSNSKNVLKCNKDISFKYKLNKLILNNVFWARSFIISSLSDLPDKNEIKKRLLKNQQGFAQLLASLYGEKISDQFIKLLLEHKEITVNLIEAIKNHKNANDIKKIESNWYKNIQELAVFINKINPKLSVRYLVKLLNGLLKLTKKEIILRSQKKWKEDIDNFDQIVNYASFMAQNLANLILTK